VSSEQAAAGFHRASIITSGAHDPSPLTNGVTGRDVVLSGSFTRADLRGHTADTTDEMKTRAGEALARPDGFYHAW
jgi:hypothetical protein